jgi:hypothetical protein
MYPMAPNVKVTNIPPKKLQPSNFLPLGSGVGAVRGREVVEVVEGIVVEFGVVVVEEVEIDDSVVAGVVVFVVVGTVVASVVELSGVKVVVGADVVVVSFVEAVVVL